MATFTCEAHLAEVARTAGFKVTREPGAVEHGRPFRVRLGATGREAHRLKTALFRAAFQFFHVTRGCGCCHGVEAVARPVLGAAAVFDLGFDKSFLRGGW